MKRNMKDLGEKIVTEFWKCEGGYYRCRMALLDSSFLLFYTDAYPSLIYGVFRYIGVNITAFGRKLKLF